MHVISELKGYQLAGAVDVLSRAFLNDPMMLYIFPEQLDRRDLLHRICAATIRYGLLYGETYSTCQTTGVACWLKPGETRPTYWRLLRAGMIFLPWRIGKKAWKRFNNVLASTEHIHRLAVTEPHWHLWSLAVAPAAQGRGIGNALIRPVLQKADYGHIPCYLDTFDQANTHFYKKHGFYVVQEGRVGADGPSFWAMVREGGL